jgi:hypothetical protein
MKGLLLAMLLAGCACPEGKQPNKPGTGSGSGSGPPVVLTGCAAARAKVEQLYRAEAQVKEPKRVDQAVADNTAMVMNDCAKAPDKVTGCIEKVSTVAELETKCLRPLDDEGTEGNDLK